MTSRVYTFLFLLLFISCSKSKATEPQTNDPVPVKWSKTTVRKGLVWYSYRGYESVSDALQVLNVLELDLKESSLSVKFQYYPAKTTLSSAIGQTPGAIAGTNASFGTPHTFIRIDGKTWCDLSEADPTDSGNWYKHEAAIWYDGVNRFGYLNYEGDPYGAITAYQESDYPNMFSTEPLLLANHSNVEWSGKKGFFSPTVFHPRTAVALTDDDKLLLITVDGRWYGLATGMSFIQLRDFIRLNFNPSWAVAMDGGGSTTMYVNGYGRSGIVNYPCNSNGASSGSYADYEGTFTERNLPTFFIITEN